MIVKKKAIVTLLALTILASSLGAYAFASINHPVNQQNHASITGTFIDDSNTFSVTPRVGTAGLAVWPIDMTANATTPTTAADLEFDTRITDSVTAGNWVIDLALTNNTNLPSHATWSVTFQVFTDGTAFGVFFSQTTHYLTTRNPVTPGAFILLTINLGTNLITPMSYVVIIQRIS